MLFYVCLFALAAFASAAQLGLPMSANNPLISNRIVGGYPIDIKEVPYQASLQIGTFHICGGSIINNRFIMTAAHCIVGNEGSWDNMNVRLGSSQNDNGGQLIKVIRFYSHPEYDPRQNWINDIALIQLERTIFMDYTAQPVRLPNHGSPLPINQLAKASGWGRLTESGVSPRDLQAVDIPINDPIVCENAYGPGFNRLYHLCAASIQGNHSTCQGDSGGPLVYAGVQYGIVSWANGCAAPNYPTVFAHLPNLRKFITDIVGL